MKKIFFALVAMFAVPLSVLTVYGESENVIDENVINVDGFFRDGTIDNAHWGIVVNDTTAVTAISNTENLQRAIDSAAENGVRDVKLQNAAYHIDGSRVTDTRFRIPSNIRLNLNGASLIQIANSSERYSVVMFDHVENSAVFNGKIIGDRYDHNYNVPVDDIYKSTHEWGHGVEVRAGQNIDIFNLEIFNMTGDGIYVNGYNFRTPETVTWAKNINIRDNEIYNCRRQGLSVTDLVDGLEFYNNYVHSISGGPRDLPLGPEACIDLEANTVNFERTINNITIRNNKLVAGDDSNRFLAVVLYKGPYRITIKDNEIHGDIYIQYSEQVLIENNRIKGEDDSRITQLQVRGRDDGAVKDVIIRNNSFTNYRIIISGVGDSIQNIENIALVGNICNDTFVRIISTQSIVMNNQFTASRRINYAIQIPRPNGGTQYIHHARNTFSDHFTENIIYFSPPYTPFTEPENPVLTKSLYNDIFSRFDFVPSDEVIKSDMKLWHRIFKTRKLRKRKIF